MRDPRTDPRGCPPRHLCPLVEHAPQTFEGRIVLDLVRANHCLKIGLGGIEGLDTAAAMARLALHRPRIDAGIAYQLLDAAEAGMLAGCEDRNNPPDEGTEETG